MNYPMAIVIAAALIAGAIFFSNQNDLDAAGNGTWTGIGVDTDDNAWAVNAQTGTMRTCFLGQTTIEVYCNEEK